MRREMKCRDCGLCNTEAATCTRTGREVTLDSIRNCKFGIDKKYCVESNSHDMENQT